MDYIHFRLDYFDKKINGNQTRYHYDAHVDFMERYIVPFVNKSNFIFNGAHINRDDVTELKLYKSSTSFNDCSSQYIRKHLFPFVGDFLTCTDYFTDITADCTARFDNVIKNDDMEK